MASDKSSDGQPDVYQIIRTRLNRLSDFLGRQIPMHGRSLKLDAPARQTLAESPTSAENAPVWHEVGHTNATRHDVPWPNPRTTHSARLTRRLPTEAEAEPAAQAPGEDREDHIPPAEAPSQHAPAPEDTALPPPVRPPRAESTESASPPWQAAPASSREPADAGPAGEVPPAGPGNPGTAPSSASSRAERALPSTIESFGIQVERFAAALMPAGTSTPLADELLSGMLSDAPPVPVRTWLRALLYLGRAVAPACRDALLAGDLPVARALAEELLQAAPTVVGYADLSLALSAGDPAIAPEAPGQPAPLLRQALATEPIAHCLAHLRDDLIALEHWVRQGATVPLSDTSAQAQATQPLLRPVYIPGLPVLPTPAGAAAQLSLSDPWGPPGPTPQTPWKPAASPNLATAPSWRREAPRELDHYQSGPRAWGMVSSIALMLLLVAVVVQLVGVGATSGGLHGVATAVGAKSQPAARLGNAPSTRVSPKALATPVPTSPPTPAATPVATALPDTGQGAGAAAPVVPLAQALTLSCGGPGAPLPLHNPGGVSQTWSLLMPPGLLAEGTRGIVNPGKTFIIHLWELGGQPAGVARIYVQSAGQQTAVNLTLPGC